MASSIPQQPTATSAKKKKKKKGGGDPERINNFNLKDQRNKGASPYVSLPKILINSKHKDIFDNLTLIDVAYTN